MQQVSENTYVETSYRGCNPGFVVVRGGVVMIDAPQRPADALAWRELVLSKGKPLYLIHTEAHPDHVLGDHYFPEPVLVCHEDIPGRLPTSPELLQPVKDRYKDDPKGLPPIDRYELRAHRVTYSNRMALHVGGQTFELVNLPGHTAEQTAVVIPEERVAFTGDNVDYRCQVFIQEGSPWQWMKTLEKIGELDVDVLVPGHGATCDRSYLPEMASFLQEWVDAVQIAVDRGLSRDEALATVAMPRRYPVEGNRVELEPLIFQVNVTNIYDRIVSGRR